jgi:hypothetical protein
MLSKGVDLEVSLDYHAQLVGKVGKGIAQTKRRLYDAELLLNLEPPPDEKQLVQQWSVVVNDVLTKKTQMQFPSLRRMKQEREIQQQLEAESLTQKQGMVARQKQRKEKDIMERQAQNLRNMVLHKAGKFGGSIKGETLRTIQNYEGANCVYTGTRTLIRKEGNAFADVGTALPPWFGPQYYDLNLKEERPKTHYQVPFKSSGRSDVPDGVYQRNANFRRKQQVKNRKSPDYIPSASTSSGISFKELLAVDDSSSPDADDFGMVTPPDEVENYDVSSVKKSASSGSYFIDRKTLASSASSYRRDFCPSKSLSSHDSMLKSHSYGTTGSLDTIKARHQKPPPRLNPVHAHHEYALKILSTEEKQSRKWQVPDFTKGALSAQPSVEFDEYRIEDTFNQDECTQQTNCEISQASIDSEKALKAGAKYNADIFFMQPTDYRPPSVLLPHFRSSNTSRVATPDSTSRITSPADRFRSSRSPLQIQSPGKSASKKKFHPSTNNLHLDQLSSDQSIGSVVDDWCKSNGVINTKVRKGRKKHDDFLEQHPKLPSIALSLSGLLLDENPYTEQDEIIHKNRDCDIDSIKV